MKTILVLTDFSGNANIAADYAMALAKKIKANLLLGNAFLVPAEVPMAGMSVWPQQEYTILSQGSVVELNLLKKRLQVQQDIEQNVSGFDPEISISSVDGRIADITNGETDKDIGLIVAGTHEKEGIIGWLLANNADTMIDQVTLPLLLVPHPATFKPVKRIAFATDLVYLDKDENALYQLVNLARPLNAEILITHMQNKKSAATDYEKRIKTLLTAVSNKANYPNIYYKALEGETPENALLGLCENGQIDMLAMVHQEHNLIKRIFGSSHTQKMAAKIHVPLLVLPNA